MTGPRRFGRNGERGQVLVVFVLMMFVLIGMVAIVIDISVLWSHRLHMQRAADAASLAGAVYLPGNISGAVTAARNEARKNGFIHGAAGVTISAVQAPSNTRQLNVTINGPVDWTFAQVFNVMEPGKWDSTAITVRSKAVYVLPVPMGSPQNYFGVGDFLKTTTTTTTNAGNTDWHPIAGIVPGGQWSNPASAATNNNQYATEATSGHAQQWNIVNLQADLPTDASLVIDGLQVRLTDVYLTGSGTSTSCRPRVETSWNAGSSWSTAQLTAALVTSTSDDKTLGAAGSTASWGSHTWVRNDFFPTNFRVRVTWLDNVSGCSSSRSMALDLLEARVDFHTTTTTTVTATAPVKDPNNVTLASQGFWGAVITRGGNRNNGDQFSPENDDGPTNPDYDVNGYDYTVIIPGGAGRLSLYDPTFCETGSNSSGGFMGTGDHWIGGSPNGVTTVFSLWNENGTPYNTEDDTQVATTGSTFANERQADYSGTLGDPPNSGLTDCANGTYHNKWYSLATGLAAGRYRMNVTTSSSNNNSTNAENMWSAWVSSSSGKPQVYGAARMAAYNNLPAGTQLFYLAQIDAANAGRTMSISLFDPGDVSGNAYLKIMSPDGNSYDYVTFSYSADNGRSGNSNTIQTASSGGSLYNGAVITIDVPLPATYGASGLTPPGETQAGWWKIEYQVSGGNDTTTWQVGIRGTPVHLLPN